MVFWEVISFSFLNKYTIILIFSKRKGEKCQILYLDAFRCKNDKKNTTFLTFCTKESVKKHVKVF